jgi:hypothetical protein
MNRTVSIKSKDKLVLLLLDQTLSIDSRSTFEDFHPVMEAQEPPTDISENQSNEENCMADKEKKKEEEDYGKVRGRINVRNFFCENLENHNWGIMTPIDMEMVQRGASLSRFKTREFWMKSLGISATDDADEDDQTFLELKIEGDLIQGKDDTHTLAIQIYCFSSN